MNTSVPPFKVFKDVLLFELERIQAAQKRLTLMAKMYPDIFSNPQEKIKQIIQMAIVNS